jgi:primosomal protein N'
LQQTSTQIYSINEIYDYGLYLLNSVLNTIYGKTLQNYPPMLLSKIDWATHQENNFISIQLNYNRNTEASLANAQELLLNTDQLLAYKSIIALVHEKDARMFFLHGPGGTGKTFVYKTLCH